MPYRHKLCDAEPQHSLQLPLLGQGRDRRAVLQGCSGLRGVCAELDASLAGRASLALDGLELGGKAREHHGFFGRVTHKRWTAIRLCDSAGGREGGRRRFTLSGHTLATRPS